MTTATRTGFSAAGAVRRRRGRLVVAAAARARATSATRRGHAPRAPPSCIHHSVLLVAAAEARADDHRHERLVVGRGRRRLSDRPALSQHDGAVGDLRDVLEVVRDQDHRDAARRAAGAMSSSTCADSRSAERRGRLVEDHQPLRRTRPRAARRSPGAGRRTCSADLLARVDAATASRSSCVGASRRSIARSRSRREPAEHSAGAAARGRSGSWRPRRGCRTARGPGAASRCRRARAARGRAEADRPARRAGSRRRRARARRRSP